MKRSDPRTLTARRVGVVSLVAAVAETLLVGAVAIGDGVATIGVVLTAVEELTC